MKNIPYSAYTVIAVFLAACSSPPTNPGPEAPCDPCGPLDCCTHGLQACVLSTDGAVCALLIDGGKGR